MKRNREIKLRLTDEELDRLNKLANTAGLSREEFIRQSLAGVRIKEKPPMELMPMIMQIRRVGITLDQILKRSRETGFTDMPELRRALKSNRELEKRIVEIYAPY